MNLLLHCCCGPCTIQCVEALMGEPEPFRLNLFWYNPNIHPVTEYLNRREAFVQYAQSVQLNPIFQDVYGLRSFINGVGPDFSNRCEYCYRLRLEAAAAYGARNGYDGFSTTLLISPYQNHELICDIAEALSRLYQIAFVYRDFRPLFREGQQSARDKGLYLQKYCGCIFSEEDRYQKKLQKLSGN